MIHLENGPIRCNHCQREKRPEEPFWGPRMWAAHQFTCRHEVQYSCPECWIDKRLYSKCSQCGCEEEFT